MAWSPAAAWGEIRWRSGPAEIVSPDRAELEHAITELLGRANARHIVVQFDRPIRSAEREELQRAGVNLLRYVGSRAFFASFSDSSVDGPALSAVPFLTGVRSIERAWKLDPRISAGEVPGWAVVADDAAGGKTVVVYVLFHPDVPLSTEAAGAVERHGGEIRGELESINGLVVEVPLSNIEAMADEDVVQWVEWPLPRMSEVNDSNRAITEADVVQAPPYDLDGSGVTVLVYDGGTARATHLDFQDRLTVHDSSGMANHATHVSGTIGGAGVADSTYKGMAPGVTLLSYGLEQEGGLHEGFLYTCLLYTSPSPRDRTRSRMPSSA